MSVLRGPLMLRSVSCLRRSLIASNKVFYSLPHNHPLQMSRAIIAVRYFSGGTTAASDVLPELVVTASTSPIAGLGYWPKDLIMCGIEHLHNLSGLEYWAAIASITLGVRILLIPLAISTMRSTAKMSAMRPVADKLSKKYKENPKFDTDVHLKQKMAEEMKALWKIYDVNPLKSLAMPLIQMPVFISFFLAIRDMSELFPGFKTGGILWFTDLSIADPTYILPIMNAVSFWIMVEIGADGMEQSQANTLKLVMRGLAVVMIPATMHFSQGLFVYWSTNNAFSILQTLILKHPGLRKKLKIPALPAADATPKLQVSQKLTHFFTNAYNSLKTKDSSEIELLGNLKPPPVAGAAPVRPKVVTYAANPQYAKKKKL